MRVRIIEKRFNEKTRKLVTDRTFEWDISTDPDYKDMNIPTKRFAHKLARRKFPFPKYRIGKVWK